MYGGLFGDLPSEKSKKQQEETDHEGLSQNDSRPQTSVVQAPLPPKKPVSMMFVPQQARRKGQKRPLSGSKAAITTSKTSPPKVVAEEEIVPSEVTENVAVQQKEEKEHGQGSEQLCQYEQEPDGANEAETSSMNATFPPLKTSSPPAATVEADSEPEYLRQLHESAKNDPYDPHKPNDLLFYLERQRVEAERQKLIRQQQESIQEQEALRQQLAQERQKLEREGDVDKIVEHRLQHTMGRGRGGMANLPAWLVEKQRKQQLEKK